ncbi:MAG: hypothetical protein ACE1ZQ_06020 [Ignavibacteriaceae bacterium]
MTKLTDDKIKLAFEQYLQGEENLKYWAFGVKQPNIFLIVLLLALFILQGIIAIFWLTKNYLIALTDNNLLELEVASISNVNVKKHTEYSLSELSGKVLPPGYYLQKLKSMVRQSRSKQSSIVPFQKTTDHMLWLSAKPSIQVRYSK